jgi:formylmethanofuran dehydrogenase subunit C
MKEIILKVKKIPELGIEADVISPDVFAGKSMKEIESLEVYFGNRREKLNKFFELTGNSSVKPEDLRVVVEGDVSGVKRIGQGMSAGVIHVNGDTGMHLGSKMRGGEITVDGDSASWVGMEMTGGKITIKGNAGNYVGSAYRGNWEGMKDGEIIVQGNVGSNSGGCITGGSITVKGNAGDFLGVRMVGGLITVEGVVSSRAGAEMHSGSIIVNGKIREMLPSFRREKSSEKKGFIEYTGDLAENGEGKIYVKE